MPDSDPQLTCGDLEEFVELAPGAAEIISQCGADLHLGGLHSISVEDVRALNRKPWRWNGYNLQANDLDLSGLETISLEVAEALAERFATLPDDLSPGDLVLNGLQSLPADIAAALARFPGEIKMDGLLSLDAEAAKALAAHRGNLSLDGLSSLTEEMAEAILGAPYQAEGENEEEEYDDNDNDERGRVSLGGLEEMCPAVASRFVARFRGTWIQLPRLKALDAETARSLGQHDSDLAFEGIAQLDAETASALALCKGDLSLDGLANLQPDVAAALAKHAGNLSLDSIVSLDDESAEALGSHQGNLSLAGLCSLSEAGAGYLANHDGELKVDVSSLPDEVREILTEHPSLFQIDIDEPARLTGRMRATLSAAGIAAVCARYDGIGDDGGFESFAVTLRDGTVLDVKAYYFDADDLAEAIRDAESDPQCSEEQSHTAAKLILQLVWSGIPCGWELDSGSFGEVTIDCADGTITVSHTWRGQDDEDGDSTDDDDVDEHDEDIEDSTDDEDFGDEDVPHEENEDSDNEKSPGADSSGAHGPREDDQVLTADVAELSDILHRVAPRKDWLDAHVDHLPIWERAAERGTAHGFLIVGLCHWFGVANDMDHSIAKDYFEKAAMLGEPQAQFSLGQAFEFLAHEESEDTSESVALADGYRADAYRWYLESAKSGLSLAQMKVGEALWKGAGVDEDEIASIRWITAAAEQGNREAAFALAKLLLTDRPSAGITRDRAQALEWGRQAVAHGHEEAASWVRLQECFGRLTLEMAREIFENWKQEQRSEDESDNEAPPTPAGPFDDPQDTVTNSVGMKLVPIPAGDFLMGSSEECPLGDTSEEFQHPVRITRPFLMGMHPVTQAQYERVTGTNPSHFKGDNLPVEQLWWKDSQRFCELLSALPEEQQAGRRYRLPTEAEWEYACRAGTTTPFNTGDSLTPQQARFASTGYRITPKQTAPVGTYPPNAWGLFDMHGNVWEWTNDWFSSDYFEESPVDDPQGPESGTHHTLRGGSASVQAEECYSAIRGEAQADGPEPESSDERFAFYGDFGIRVVCETTP